VDIDGDDDGQCVVVEANSGKRIILTIFFGRFYRGRACWSSVAATQTPPSCTHDRPSPGQVHHHLRHAANQHARGHAAREARAGSTKQLVSAAAEGATGQ
jgi:hypothetical protein